MIPTWLQAVLLGIVQGLTEFIPVSSSGHLVLIPYVLGWERPGLPFDVALHIGTAAAIVLYFRVELFGMAASVFRGGTPQGRLYRRLAILLVLATVPVGVAGVTLEDTFERIFETPTVAASMLFVTAAVLWGGEKWRARRVTAARTAAAKADSEGARVWTGDWVGEAAADAPGSDLPELEVGEDPDDPAGTTLDGLGLRQALTVGFAQILALFPGMSRSGTTIMAGMAAGLTREAATRFSFLLALPAMVGAAVVSAPGLTEPGPYAPGEIAGGVVAAFVSGYLAIAFLVRLVARTGLHIFARYLVLVGALGLLATAMLGPPGTA